jgi:cell division inhibitor SepF
MQKASGGKTMANPFGELLQLLRLGDDEDYDDDEYYEDEYEDEIDPEEAQRLIRRDQKRQERAERKAGRRTSSYDQEEDYQDPDPAPAPRRTSVRTASNKVVPIRTTSRGLEVCICKPDNFGDSTDACEMLLQGRAVVVNLEGIDIMEAQRIMDVISGCIFAISGKMHQISRYIFIFSPENVDISGDYLELSQDDEFGIPTLNKEF